MPSITLYFGIMFSFYSYMFSQHTAICLCVSSHQKKKKTDKFHVVFMLCTIGFTYMCRHCKSVKISRCICSSTCTHCLSFLSFSHSLSLSYRFHKWPDSFKGRITERITILQWSHSLRNTKQKKKKKSLEAINHTNTKRQQEGGWKRRAQSFCDEEEREMEKKKACRFQPKMPNPDTRTSVRCLLLLVSIFLGSLSLISKALSRLQ